MKLYAREYKLPPPPPAMTVQQLIDRLKDFPRDLPVRTDGGGDPYMAGPVTRISVEQVPEGMRPLPGLENKYPERWVELG